MPEKWDTTYRSFSSHSLPLPEKRNEGGYCALTARVVLTRHPRNGKAFRFPGEGLLGRALREHKSTTAAMSFLPLHTAAEIKNCCRRANCLSASEPFRTPALPMRSGHCKWVAVMFDVPLGGAPKRNKFHRQVERRLTPDRNGSGLERKQSVRGPLYFPNAFFSSGSISPLAAMGSKISVSP